MSIIRHDNWENAVTNMNSARQVSATQEKDWLLLIDGEWRSSESGQWIDVFNPATEQVIRRVAKASATDIYAALDAAERGFQLWRDVPAPERSKVLRTAASLIRERADQLASDLTAEQGKPLAQARLEIITCADIYEWSADEAIRTYGRIIPARQAGVMQMVLHDPIGPVAAFTPWNFPGSQAARKIAAAVATGCSMIIKPPEEAPSAAIGLVGALMDAGLPKGVVNILFGVPAEISSRLIDSPIIRKISFTGSVPVGKHLAGLAAQQMKPATMELGGHSPVLVFDDVNPQETATKLAANKFRNAGQICISPTRVMVQDAIYEPFLGAFVEAANKIRLGDGTDPATDMGPLANDRRLRAVSNLIEDAVTRGARLETGGRRRGNIGYFYEPTVLSDVPADARILHEEPFGPVVLMSRFSDVDSAIKTANDTPFGLASYAFTGNPVISDKLIRRLESGVVSINSGIVGLTETPFGGIKQSGYGREGGSEGLSAYYITKFVAHASAS
jgi:succinate-semialdehyde dehydrogenase / glutarate-semialdehyde dehydrogenase